MRTTRVPRSPPSPPSAQVPPVDGTCVDCNGPGQGTLNRECVDCDTALEGSAPNPGSGECQCPLGQEPSEDGEDGIKCEDFDPDFGVCEPGQGLVDGTCVDCNGPGQGTLNRDCVDCDTALEGSAPNADTGECECPLGQEPSEDGEDGMKCEDFDPDFGVCEPGQGLVDG